MNKKIYVSPALKGKALEPQSMMAASTPGDVTLNNYEENVEQLTREEWSVEW